LQGEDGGQVASLNSYYDQVELTSQLGLMPDG
jgi:hypothetical protein